MDSHTDLSHFDEMKRLDNLFGNLSESVKSKDEANQKIADQLEDLHKRSESELFDKHQRTFHPSDDIEVDISFADEPKPIPQPEPVPVEPELPEPEQFNPDTLFTEIKEANAKIDALSIGLQSQIDNILDDADDIVYPIPEEPIVINPTAFYPTWSNEAAHASGAVDIASGSWYMNGATVTKAQLNIGDKDNTYIVATITHGTADPFIPTAITIAAQAAGALASEFATKRNICVISFDDDDNPIKINRLQIGDICQNLNAIKDTTWSDGGAGKTVSVTTAEQYNTSTFKYEVKKTEFKLIHGVLYIGEEDATWTTAITFAECP